MRLSRSAGAIALALAAVVAGVVAPQLGASADDANAECTNNNDITIVVDFQDLGGGVNVRCAPQPVDSGRAAFVRTNIAVDDYRGFVCRIAGKPEEGPCDRYPPASAYWVYWVAARGGTWCPSNYGIDTRTPPPGSIDGWSFAKNRKSATLPPPRYPVPPPIPGTAPHALNEGDCDAATTRTTTTSPSPSPTPSPSPNPTSPSGQTPNPTAPPATTRGSRATTSTAAGAATSAPTSTSSSSSSLLDVAPTTSTSRVPFGNVDLTIRNTDHDGNSPWPFIFSVGAIGAFAAGGLFLRRRRA